MQKGWPGENRDSLGRLYFSNLVLLQLHGETVSAEFFGLFLGQREASLTTPEQTDTDWRQFVILKIRDLVPIIGGCTRCGVKFFAPSKFFRSAFAAEQY